jgi:hypothetical protein
MRLNSGRIALYFGPNLRFYFTNPARRLHRFSIIIEIPHHMSLRFRHLTACLLLACLALLPARAEFELIEESDFQVKRTSENVLVPHRFVVRFTPRQAVDRGEEGSLSSRQSCLIAIPGATAPIERSSWSLRAFTIDERGRTPISPIDRLVIFSLQPVQMGKLFGLRLGVSIPEDKTLFVDEYLNYNEIKELEIHLSSYSEYGKVSGRQSTPLKQDSAMARMTRSLFINGDSVESLTEPQAAIDVTRGGAPTLPQPQGSLRLPYEGGDEILAVPMADIGVTSATFLNALYSYQGTPIQPGNILDDENLWIYAPRRHTLQDRNDNIFVEPDVSPTPSAGLATRNAFGLLSPQGVEVVQQRREETRFITRYQRNGPMTLGDRFVAHLAFAGDSFTLPLYIFDQLTTTEVRLRVESWGNNVTTANPDHNADYTFAGIDLPRASWDGRTQHIADETIQLSEIPTTYTLDFTHAIDSNSPFDGFNTDLQLLRSVTLDWTGYPRVDFDLKGTVDVPPTSGGEQQLVTIGGFPVGTTADDLILLDVTRTTEPIRLVNPSTFASTLPDGSPAVAVEFEAGGDGGTFFVQAKSAVKSFDPVVPSELLPEPFPLGARLRGIYVRDAIYEETLAPLVEMRGPGILEMTPQATYDAYNNGQQSPDAIRQALIDLIEAHSNRNDLPSILLVGYGSLDPRDYLGLDKGYPQLPNYPKLGVASVNGFEFISDVPYELLFGDDVLPDMLVSRIPARTTETLRIAVERAVAHEAIRDDLISEDRPAVFIADDEASFVQTVDLWASQWAATSHTSFNVYVPNDVSEAVEERAFVFDALTTAPSGLSFISYVGHGGRDIWGGEKIMNSTFPPDIATQGKWPVVAVFNCFNGDYAHPTYTGEPLCEAWMFATNPTDPNEIRGAIANIAPTGADTLFPQSLFAQTMLDVLTQDLDVRPRTVGELMAQTRGIYLTNFPEHFRTAEEFMLFGDPDSHLTIDFDNQAGTWYIRIY